MKHLSEVSPPTGKNRLRGSSCYLAGPIDRVADSGKEWRDEITPFLRDLGVTVFDPLRKPLDIGLEDDDGRDTRILLKRNYQFDDLTKIVKVVRLADLRMVDKADFLIVNYDMSIHMCGTMEELFLANREKKPILIMCPQGKRNIPDWLYGVMPHQFFFQNWEEVRHYINYVNGSEHVEHLKRWIFFTQHGAS